MAHERACLHPYGAWSSDEFGDLRKICGVCGAFMTNSTMLRSWEDVEADEHDNYGRF